MWHFAQATLSHIFDYIYGVCEIFLPCLGQNLKTTRVKLEVHLLLKNNSTPFQLKTALIYVLFAPLQKFTI